MERVILHIDMDAFFASIEQADFPEYRDRPVVVGSDPKEGAGRGVVSAASYEARQFGIHSALPISKAYKLCPHAVFVRPRGKRYSEVSRQIMNILRCYTPLIEQTSIDEAFIDCSASLKLFGPPVEIAKKIKHDIFTQTGLTASIGIASNKSVAKIASDLDKPDGITVCPSGEEKKFLAELNISRLWGAGKKTVKLLNELGFFKVKDLADTSENDIRAVLGRNGVHLWHLANGIDERNVIAEVVTQKSIGREHTFAEDTNDKEILEKQIVYICDTISRELRSDGLMAKTVTLKIRLLGFDTYTRSFSFNQPADNFKTVKEKALKLFRNFNSMGKPVRLVGVSLSNFKTENGCEQLELFSNTRLVEKDRNRKEDQLLDTLKKQYGQKITRASFLKEND